MSWSYVRHLFRNKPRHIDGWLPWAQSPYSGTSSRGAFRWDAVTKVRGRQTAALILVVLLHGCSALRSVASAEVQNITSPQTAGPSGVDCVVQELSRERLTVEGGRYLYVDPVSLVRSSQGEILLAGSHNYMFGRNDTGKWKMVGQDSVFGAVLAANREARTVPSPIPLSRTSGIRAVARPDGTWSVVFAEKVAGDSLHSTVVALWHGVLNGPRWAMLERLPLPSPPEGTPVRPLTASSLVASGDSLAWVLEHRASDGGGGLIVYERVAGNWTYHIIPTGYASADIAYSTELGLVIASEQADFRAPPSGTSLVLWVRQPTWRILRTAVPGAREQVNGAWLAIPPEAGVLTWNTAVPDPEGGEHWETHAILGAMRGDEDRVIVIDPAVAPMAPPWFVRLDEGVNLWLTDHRVPQEHVRDIRMTRDSAGLAVLLGSIPTPYLDSFGAVTSGPSEVLVSGASIDREQETLFSLLVRVRVNCPAGMP